MTSQRPITYDEAFRIFANKTHEEREGSEPLRNNTVLRLAPMEDDDLSVEFEVVLYDDVVARLSADGVRVWAPKFTNTTKNRINDVLIPLGWKVRQIGGAWKVCPYHTWQSRTSKDFVSGMMFDRMVTSTTD